jgi:3-deoxy-manno-octulosonate cytidylyltransferase (CMP-KDO synthetase)
MEPERSADRKPFSGKAIGVIPARLASSRFSNKPLTPIHGIPMICWTARSASQAEGLSEVIVAAEDQEIVDTVERYGGKAQLVQGTFRTGSDRIAAAVKGMDASVVVNIQGDEPLIEAAVIDKALQMLDRRGELGITTVVTPITDIETYLNPNCVKVVLDTKGKCLYFSRSPIPARHKRQDEDSLKPDAPYWLHIGVYCYRRKVLTDFAALPQHPLERIEGLEQLRFLEAGGQIGAVEVKDCPPGINAPEDLQIVEKYIEEHGIEY